MGGMFTVIKVRDELARGVYDDPGWYRHPEGEVARLISSDPAFGRPERRGIAPTADTSPLPRATRKGHAHH